MKRYSGKCNRAGHASTPSGRATGDDCLTCSRKPEAPEGPRYLVEVRGMNASPSYCYSSAVRLECSTSGLPGWCALRVADVGDRLVPPVALFRDKGQAERAGVAAAWENQTYRVRAARGCVRECGRVVD